MNIGQIITDFRSKANANDFEVVLFRKFMNSIVNYSQAVFVDETHGNKAIVSFSSIVSGSKSCEISDLLIVTVSVDGTQARATFWQAKRNMKPKWRVTGGGLNNFDFIGQFNQWELLAYRPRIQGVRKFRPHPELLSGASSSSIGSFGVFYLNKQNIEVNYSIAEMVTSSSMAPRPRMVINEKLEQYMLNKSEVLVRKNLKGFLEAINRFQVGSILNMSVESDRWILSYVKKKTGRLDLLKGIDDSNMGDETNIHDSNDDGMSILLIPLDGGRANERTTRTPTDFLNKQAD